MTLVQKRRELVIRRLGRVKYRLRLLPRETHGVESERSPPSRDPGARYRVEKRAEYNPALVRRGSLTIWMPPEAIAACVRTQVAGVGGRRVDLGRCSGIWPTTAPDRGHAGIDHRLARS